MLKINILFLLEIARCTGKMDLFKRKIHNASSIDSIGTQVSGFSLEIRTGILSVMNY